MKLSTNILHSANVYPNRPSFSRETCGDYKMTGKRRVWMDSDIMESILYRLDRKLCLEKSKIVIFWDNATCHSETIEASLTNIKICLSSQKCNIATTNS